MPAGAVAKLAHEGVVDAVPQGQEQVYKKSIKESIKNGVNINGVYDLFVEGLFQVRKCAVPLKVHKKNTDQQTLVLKSNSKCFEKNRNACTIRQKH